MKVNALATKWVVDALMYAGFLLCFFTNVTGLELHQWLGVAGGALAAYHLVTHWAWVRAVTCRLLGRTSGQARLYYLLDAGVLAGLAVITTTGIVISTWLDLPLPDYAVWKDLHVLASVVTLLLLAVKLGLHWRWIVRTAKQVAFGTATPAKGRVPRSATVPVVVSRREFLSVLGLVGVASAGAAINVWDSFPIARASSSAVEQPKPRVLAQAVPASVVPPQVVPAPASSRTTSGRGRGAAARRLQAYFPEGGVLPGSVSQSADPQSGGTASGSTQPSSSEGSTAAPSQPAACVVRCDRACSYPGECRRYIDGNGNGLCDLGECI